MDNPFMAAPSIADQVNMERVQAQQKAKGVKRPQAKADTFLESMALGAKKRALGLAQLGAEVAGYDDTETYKDMQDLAKQYEMRGTGTGAKGLAGEILGDPLTALGFAFPAVRGAGLLSTGTKLATTGAAFGALERGTAPMQDNQSRLEQTAYGAGAGAVAAPLMAGGAQLAGRAIEKTVAPVAEKIGRPAVSAFKQAYQFVKSNPDDALSLEISGMTPDALNKAVQGLSDDAAKQFKQATKSGLNKKQAYLAAKFQEKGGVMTRAQAAQDPYLQRLEDKARTGMLGDEAYAIANNQEQLNQGALRRWAGELLADVTGNPNAVVDETTTGDILGGALRTRYKELKEPMQEAYRVGLKSRAKVAMQHLEDLPKHAREVLREKQIEFGDTVEFKKDFQSLQKLTRRLDGGDSAIKSVKWPALERMVQRMNSKARWDVPLSTVKDYSQRQDIMAYRAMAGELRSRQDDLLIRNVLDNVDDAAIELRKAPELNKAFRAAFDKKSPLTKLVENDATDREIVDVLGSGVIGKKGTTRVLREIKGALGEDSEALGQIQGTFLNRIMRRAYDAGDDAKFGQAVKGELKKLKSQNKELYDELFAPSQQRAIEDFADVSNQLSEVVRSRVNPSGSGVLAGDLMIDTFRRMGPAGSVIADGLQAIKGQAGQEMQADAAIRSIIEPLKRLPLDTKVVSELFTRAAKPLAAKTAGGIAGELGGDGFMDTEGVPTRITVNPQQESNPFLDGNTFNNNPFMDNGANGTPDQGSIMNYSPLSAKSSIMAEEFSPRALTGEIEAGDQALLDSTLSANSMRQEQPAFRVSPDYLQKLAMVESSGNPLAQAKTSSAKGLFQFTDGTWNEMVRKYGDELGVTKKDIFDPVAQAKMAIKFTEENANYLMGELGRAPTSGELYAAHFLGKAGAKSMLKAKGSGKKAAKINPAAAKANRSIFFDNGRARSVDEVLAILNRKVS